MIKANELRIGNWLEFPPAKGSTLKTEIRRYCQIDIDDLKNIAEGFDPWYNDIKPIPPHP